MRTQLTPQSKIEWLNYLETCHPKLMELGLQRMLTVGKRLNVLQFDCPVITVAGTNGKGSCVALMRTILESAGYQIGTYTSPHLIEYNERIQINGQCVSDETLCHLFAQIEDARQNDSLTYFEFTTLAALLLFQQSHLDAIILEVGLGGRLDATNCIDADISVITTIDLDHQAWLGHTRELIGKEKAGIMRPNKPCVFGDFSLPISIYEQANALNAPLYLQGKNFDYKKQGQTWLWKGRWQTLENLPLPGIELQNAATVLQVMELLREVLPLINDEAIILGLQNVFLSGRFQSIHYQERTLILDVAHNPAGGRCLAQRLIAENHTGNTYAVVGMLQDKDIQNTLAPLLPLVDHWILTDLEAPRGASAEELSQCLNGLRPAASIASCQSPIEALQIACEQTNENDRILAFGSFHAIGPILKTIVQGDG